MPTIGDMPVLTSENHKRQHVETNRIERAYAVLMPAGQTPAARQKNISISERIG